MPDSPPRTHSRSMARRAVFREFECPVCDAYNPWDDGFSHKDEVFCSYCGTVLDVRVAKDADPATFQLLAP